MISRINCVSNPKNSRDLVVFLVKKWPFLYTVVPDIYNAIIWRRHDAIRFETLVIKTLAVSFNYIAYNEISNGFTKLRVTFCSGGFHIE